MNPKKMFDRNKMIQHLFHCSGRLVPPADATENFYFQQSKNISGDKTEVSMFHTNL